MLEKFLWIFKCITMTNDKDVEEKGSNGRDRGRRRREEGRKRGAKDKNEMAYDKRRQYNKNTTRIQ